MEDLSSYSYKQLCQKLTDYNDFIKQIDAELDKRKDEEILKLRQDFMNKADALGVSIEDVLQKRRAGKGAIKYAHPDNPKQTWTGKGKKPGWMTQYLKNGGTLEQLTV